MPLCPGQPETPAIANGLEARLNAVRSHLRNHVYGLLAILIALGGTAYAATSFVQTNGQVRGCVSKKGQLKVLGRGKTRCPRGQTKIAWSQKGPAGQAGVQGPPLTFSVGFG